MRYLKHFEAFDIKNISHEETQFKELIRKLLPNNFNVYYTLYKNKGIEFAKRKLLADAEQNKFLKSEVDKIRRYEDRARKNLFRITPEDLNFYIPSKKDMKKFISDGIFTNDVKKILNKYGFYSIGSFPLSAGSDNNLLLSDKYKYSKTTNKYDTNVDVDIEEFTDESVKLGDLVQILNSLKEEYVVASDYDYDEFVELNRERLKGYSIQKKFEINLTETFNPLWSKILEINVDLLVGYRILINNLDKYKKEDYELIKITSHDILKDKFVPKVDEKASALLNNINLKNSKVLTSVGKKIILKQKQADIKYKEFTNIVLELCVKILNQSGSRYYRYLNIIKNNCPNAWELISNTINDKEGLDNATEMGDLGYGD